MAERQEYTPVFEETEADILNRVLDRVTDWRKLPGDFVYDVLAPVIPEIEQIKIDQDYVFKSSFAEYAEEESLDNLMAQVGLTRAAAIAARRLITVRANAGVVIPAGQTVSVVVLDEDGEPLTFTVEEAVTFAAKGSLNVKIKADTAGVIGNVDTTTQYLFTPTIMGVELITDAGPLTLGAEEESDQSAYDRYIYAVNNQDTGGNKNDYKRWTESVPGVAKARVIPRWQGNGTVKVVIIGTDYAPALPSVVQDAQEYLDPMLDTMINGNQLTLTGAGATKEGTSAILRYDASGDSVAAITTGFEDVIQTENQFMASCTLRVDSTAKSDELLTIQVYDKVTGVAVPDERGSTDKAELTLTAQDMSTNPVYYEFPFYWDGLQPIAFQIHRLSTDTSTTVYADAVQFTSMYGQALGEGKAPASHRVTVVPADSLKVNITADVRYTAGYSAETVIPVFKEAVSDYLKDLVFSDDPEKQSIVWAKIGAMLINTPGVSNYDNLLINGTSDDILIPRTAAPTVGTVTL